MCVCVGGGGLHILNSIHKILLLFLSFKKQCRQSCCYTYIVTLLYIFYGSKYRKNIFSKAYFTLQCFSIKCTSTIKKDSRKLTLDPSINRIKMYHLAHFAFTSLLPNYSIETNRRKWRSGRKRKSTWQYSKCCLKTDLK